MAEKGFKRKLTAILSADAVGYSRLMGEDEEKTVRTLTAYREVLTTLIQQHNGRVIDSPGDNLLADFDSVVDAVQCAVDVQKDIKVRNEKLPENRRMPFRIGINLGDIIQEEGRIYGDGVNIAARLEGLAEQGGICISRATFDQVKGKLELGYKYVGAHKVKNIKGLVRVYQILTEPETVGKVLGEKTIKKKILAISAISLSSILFFGALMIYEIYFRLPSVSIGSNSKMARPLTIGPSIAVLPFKNVTGDSKKDYFSDGLTENIITGISANPRLLVISQHSIFSFKNKNYSLQQVAEEFGIKYVVIGSVQSSNDQVRINVRLVDANTGKHLWTQLYDRDLKQIFEIQDEITIEIMKALEVELIEGEQAIARLSGPRNLEAFMRLLKAIGYWRRHNLEDNLKARREAEAAIKLAPEYSEALTILSMTYIFDIWYRTGNPIISFAQASKYIKMSIAVNENNSDAYSTLSHLLIMRKQHDEAIAAGEKAVLLNPNGADAYMALAFALYHSGKPMEAIEVSRKAFRLNPLPPSQYYHMMGHFYNSLERYEEAEKAYKRAVQLEPNNIFANIGLTYVYSLMGNTKEAEIWAKNVRRIDPNYSADDFENSPNKNRDLIKRCTEALRRAGL